MAIEKGKIPFMLSLLPYACFIAGGYMAHRKNAGVGKMFLYGLGGFAVGIVPVVIYMNSNRAKMLEDFKKKYASMPVQTPTDIEINKLNTEGKLKSIIEYANKYNMLKDDIEQKAFRTWTESKLGESDINLMVKFTKFLDENQKIDMKNRELMLATQEKYGINFKDARMKFSSDKIMKSEFGYLFGA